MLSAFNSVELLLHKGRELHIEDVGEEADKQIVHSLTEIFRLQPPFILANIMARIERADDLRIGAGAADALAVQFSDKGAFGVARRRFRKMLLGKQAKKLQLLALCEITRDVSFTLFFLGGWIDRKESREGFDATNRAE